MVVYHELYKVEANNGRICFLIIIVPSPLNTIFGSLINYALVEKKSQLIQPK